MIMQITSGLTLKSSVLKEPRHYLWSLLPGLQRLQAGFWKQTGTGCQGTSCWLGFSIPNEENLEPTVAGMRVSAILNKTKQITCSW